MKVRLYPSDAFGCGYYRMRLPSRWAGCDVDWNERLPLNWRGGKLTHVDVEDADVVVLQRPMSHRLIPMIEQLQRQDVAVVVELDDDMAALDPKHIMYPLVHPRLSAAANWKHLKDACARADLVTTTTPELARRYAGHGRYAVLPNCIEERLLRVSAEPAYDIGWTGVVASHPHDLQVTGTAIRDLLAEGFTFRVVGNADGVARALHLDDDPPATGWIPLDSYYAQAARHRVGIVPLADSLFNRAKSWLKGLEFAAVGVPFVASPTPEYVELQGYGAGMLTEKPKHWRKFLRHLLTDDASRTELAEHARHGVASLTIERNGWLWGEAWAKALENRRGRAAAA